MVLINLTTAFLVIVLTACSLKNVIVKDQVIFNRNNILITFSDQEELNLIKVLDSISLGDLQGVPFLSQFKPLIIKSCKYIDRRTRILISEKKGIFIIILRYGPPKVVHLPCDNGNFVNCAIGDVFFFEDDKELAVVYDTPKGDGVTKCSLDGKWNPVNCKTFTKDNSGLLSNDVAQIFKDEKKMSGSGIPVI